MRRLILSLILLFSCGGLAVADANCFNQADAPNPSGWRMFQPSPCPSSDTDATFKFGPAQYGAAFDMTAELGSTATTCQAVASAWENRSDDGTQTHKPNPPPGAPVMVTGANGTWPCYMKFHTRPIAEATSRAQAYWLYGYRSTETSLRGWLDATHPYIPDANNMSYADFAAAATTLCPNYDAADQLYYSWDVMVRAPVRMVDLPPNLRPTILKSDYEPHDDRPPSETKAQVNAYVNAAIRFGDSVYFYDNPNTGTENAHSGIDATDMDWILGKVAYMSLIVSAVPANGLSMPDDLAAQVAMFSAPDMSKFNYVLDPAMTTDQAAPMRALLVSTYPVGGMDTWPHGQPFGGSCATTPNLDKQIIWGIPK